MRDAEGKKSSAEGLGRMSLDLYRLREEWRVAPNIEQNLLLKEAADFSAVSYKKRLCRKGVF